MRQGFFFIKVGKGSPQILIPVLCVDLAQNSLDSLFFVPKHPLFESSEDLQSIQTTSGSKGVQERINYLLLTISERVEDSLTIAVGQTFSSGSTTGSQSYFRIKSEWMPCIHY